MFIISCIVLALSLILVIKGGDMFVDSSIDLAKRTKIPTILIGATIVSVATTLPELIVSSIAAAQGSYNLSVGNAVGSVICNTALIAGLSMAIAPSIMKEKNSPLKYVLLLVSCVLLLICGFGVNSSFSIEWYEALIFATLFVVYMVYNIYDALKQYKSNKALDNTIKEKQEKESATIDAEIKEEEDKPKQKLGITILFFILGAGMLALGAYALVESVKYISSALGISEALIGLTIVAIGTSLPELVTTITAIKKKNSELGYGNIIGANILNLTLLMAVSGLISGSEGLSISFWTYAVSIPVALVCSLIFILPLWFKNRSFRWQGITLLIIYTAYIAFLIIMTLNGITV